MIKQEFCFFLYSATCIVGTQAIGSVGKVVFYVHFSLFMYLVIACLETMKVIFAIPKKAEKVHTDVVLSESQSNLGMTGTLVSN